MLVQGQAGEFLDLWVEYIFVHVSRHFPMTQRRALVVDQNIVYRNPIQMALQTMTNKNTELEVKIRDMKNLPDGSDPGT